MLRTTVYLPDELVNLAKLRAIEEKVPMTLLVKEGLEVRLGVKKIKTIPKKFVWKTYNMGLGSKKWKREWAYE